MWKCSSSERYANQRSRSAGKAGRTSLKRRNAPLPSIAINSRSRSAWSDTDATNRSIHRYCSRDDAGASCGGVRLALDDRQEVAVFEVEEALLIGRIPLKSDLQITPVHSNRH